MKLSFKGIIIGAVTDIVLSGVLGAGLGIYVVASGGLTTLPKDQVSAATIAALQSPGLHAMQLLLGSVSSIFGGYLAARLAKHDELLNGILASWLCLGLGVYDLAAGKSQVSVPAHLALMGLTLICYFVGAYLRLRAVRAKSVLA